MNTYAEALHALLKKPTNPKLGLSRMTALLKAIGFERQRLKIIQVVGTNGKGSTCAFLESILWHNGISCGLFTSPHLITAKERIRIRRAMISDAAFIKAADRVLAASATLNDEPSFFECMLGMALWTFQEEKLAAAILEAGVGGRLDATTATLPDILGLSQIDLDHQHFLGEEVFDIAVEKCFAARKDEVVVMSPQTPEAMRGIQQAQSLIGFLPKAAPPSDQKLSLWGDYQKNNAGLALALIENLGLSTDPKKNAQALAHTKWPGRMERFEREAPLILDGAHNPSAIELLCQNLLPLKLRLVVIFGSMAGANCAKKIELLLHGGLDIAHVILYRSKNPRAESLCVAKELFLQQGFPAQKISEYESLDAAIERAQQASATLLVCGSLYVVGEIRGQLLGQKADDALPNF